MTPEILDSIVKQEDFVDGTTPYIYQIAGQQFDGEKLYREYEMFSKSLGFDDKQGQFNLHVRSKSIEAGMSKRDLMTDFCGSLHPKKNGGFTVLENEFDTIHPILQGSYTEEVINKVKEVSIETFGRIRWLVLQPKTCYSMHGDPDWFRLHVPMKTSKKSFFIVNEKYYEMHQEGGLYVIHPNKMHTAVNSNLYDKRVHIVFDTVVRTEPDYETD